MSRPLRIEFEGALYHICARGNRREHVFLTRRDYCRLEELLAQSIERYQVELLAYVLLPNHFHLATQTHRPNLARWMHWLITSYSTWFNRRHDMTGHVFQGRYKAFLIQSGNYLVEVSRYLHMNPVRGIVLGAGSLTERRARLRSYQWSSYPGYAGIRAQKSFVNEGLILGEFAGCISQHDKIRYRQFVEEALLRQIESPFKRVVWQSALGDESFLRALRDRLKSRAEQKREVTGLRAALPAYEPQLLIQRVAEHYHMERTTLLRDRTHGSEARNVAMWLLREKGGLSLREIGELFGGIDYAAVSERARRLVRAQKNQKRLRKTCQILNI